MEPNNQPTQSGERVSQGLNGVRERARKNKQERFTALLHHVTVDLLRDSYYGLKRKAAPGVDGVTWKEYETGLEDRLKDLHGRVHRGAYRALPSKRSYITEGQRQVASVGNRGAGRQDRPKRGGDGPQSDLRGRLSGILLRVSARTQPAWGAGCALCGIRGKKVNWILDLDLKGFFDNIEKEHLMEMVGRRIADTRILRLIRKWLNAGVIEDGEWSKTEKGTPQGSVISPLLANIYLHYVLDQWTDQWRQNAHGDVIIVRYADDAVIGFQHQYEAEKFLKELTGATAPVWAGTERRQDPADPVRAFRPAEPGRTWRRETGVVHLSGLPAYMRGKQSGAIRSPAHYRRRATAEETAGD